MIEQLTDIIYTVENLLWGYVGVPIVLVLGVILSFQSGFVQIRKFPSVVRTFLSFFRTSGEKVEKKGVSPLKAFFACIGGSVGVGNVVGVCTAVQIGGPGALFWIWVTALAGAIVKYSEVYLGMKYRIIDADGNYRGGPMYYLSRAFSQKWIPGLVCALLCLYGVEIFQFSVVAKSVSINFGVELYIVVGVFLVMVLFAGSGGVRRVGTIASMLIPVFVFMYVGMGFWVLANNIAILPEMFAHVVSSALSGHAAVGAFAGSTLMIAMSQGVRRGCYTGDIGIGYASVIHSETNVIVPEKQASLVIFEVFMDTFMICTTSVMLVLVTGVWQQQLDTTSVVQEALGQYFPYMNFFMPFFLFLVGYATINAYFCVGLKSAEFLMPRWGRTCYYVYAVFALVTFSFFDPRVAQSVMAIAGGLLLVVNSLGLFLMRREISFKLDSEDAFEPLAQKSIIPA
jgi:AGCS family alanine or glycine:cation symporter